MVPTDRIDAVKSLVIILATGPCILTLSCLDQHSISAQGESTSAVEPVSHPPSVENAGSENERIILEQFHSESRNESWDEKIHQEFNQRLEQNKFEGTKLLGIQCRQTICYLHVSHSSKKAKMDFHTAYSLDNDSPWGEGHASVQPPEDDQSVLYFWREAADDPFGSEQSSGDGDSAQGG